ncbi:EthD family reductase [Tateyamaria armeniaca]|uniref:EthD family reductase n=1 Tax=Tateyamaria armeniaca TaxID=2518930 RepID=A0ABW8UU49_9RHOB
MAITLQVLYPVTDGSHFNDAYYAKTHMGLVDAHMGQHIQDMVVTKGMAGGPDTPAAFHAIATFVFADKADLDAALAAAGPVLADIPKFTNATPQMLIGQTYR